MGLLVTAKATSFCEASLICIAMFRQKNNLLLLFLLIKTLFILGLERKIYRNEMITEKDKRFTHTSHSRPLRLQARLCRKRPT